jgi:hypothetical protein
MAFFSAAALLSALIKAHHGSRLEEKIKLLCQPS